MDKPGEEELRYRADLENGISKPVAEIIASFEALDAQSEETDRELKKLERQAKATGRELEFQAAKIAVANMAIKDHATRTKTTTDVYKAMVAQSKAKTKAHAEEEKATRKLEAESKKLYKTFKLLGTEYKVHKKDLEKMEKAGQGVLKFLRGLGGIARVAMMATMGLGMLTAGMEAVGAIAGAGNLVPAILAVSGSLLQLGSLAALLPTAIGGLVASMLVMKLAFAGVGSAIGAAFQKNWVAFEQSMVNMAPAAGTFIRQFIKLIPALRNVKTTIQDSFFRPLLGSTEQLAKLIPTIGAGTSKLAAAWGNVIRTLVNWVTSSSGAAFLTRLLDNASKFALMLSNHLTPVLNGLEAVVRTTQPWIDRLLNAMGSGLDTFGAWLTRIANDGTLVKWLDTAVDVLKTLGQIVTPIWTILKAISAASDGQGLTRFAIFLQKIADFLTSPQGQSGMMAFFDALTQITTALEPTLGPLMQIIGVLAVAIAKIVTAAAPGLVVLLTAIADGLGRISGDQWVALGTAIAGVMTDLAQAMPYIITFLTWIIRFLSDKNRLEAVLIIAGLLWVTFTMILPVVTSILGFFAAVAPLAAALGVPLGIIAAFIVGIGLSIAWVIGMFFLIKDFVEKFPAIWDKAWNDIANQSFIKAFLGNLLDAVKAIRDAWNDFWKAVTDPAHNLGKLNPLNLFKFAGGDVTGGSTYITNELGPEKFLSTSGVLSDIGDGNMGAWTAPSSGTVIPAGLSAAIDRAFSAGAIGRDSSDLEPTLAKAFTSKAGDTHIDESQTHVSVTVTNPASDVDVERAVVKAMKKVERDREERR